jgi:hypothetical protein
MEVNFLICTLIVYVHILNPTSINAHLWKPTYINVHLRKTTSVYSCTFVNAHLWKWSSSVNVHIWKLSSIMHIIEFDIHICALPYCVYMESNFHKCAFTEVRIYESLTFINAHIQEVVSFRKFRIYGSQVSLYAGFRLCTYT